MNVKIEQIQEAEAKTTTLQAEQSRLRREFMADGTIDDDEQKKLDDIDRKITQLEQTVTRLREEIETNKRIWEGRARDYSQVRSRANELVDFQHPDAGIVGGEVDAIEPLVADQCWADATAALDQAETSMEPVYANYLEQIAARDTYEPLRADVDGRLADAKGATTTSDDVGAQIEQAESNLEAIDAHVEARDYMAALPLCEEISVLLDEITTELERLAQLKEQYQSEWAALQPKLQQVSVCEYHDLVPMQEDIIALSDAIQESAANGDYEAALQQMPDLVSKIESFLTAYEETASEQELYESRLPSVEAELAECQTSEFEELVAQQNEINATAERMRTAAGNADYEVALQEMDTLVGLLETYLVDLGTARLRRDYEGLLESIAPQLDAAMVCTYPVLQDQVRAIEAARAAAETAAGASDYQTAIAKLEEALDLLVAFEEALAAQDNARTEYESRSAAIFARCDGIATCEYPQLAEDHQAIIDVRAEIETSVGQGDYVTALQLLDELVLTLQYVEETRDTLRAAQTEYETRLPAVINRFDGMMQCDFAELETMRDALMADRTEMETAAAAFDFPMALDLLNKIERDLNALDARRGDLEALRTQYEELYASIEGQLADVEACDHEELATKRSEILALRDEMLAAAEATDYAVAVQKANALMAPLAEFAQLEELLAEYKRRLALVEPRLETARAYTYLSLDDDKAEIESIYAAMQDDAAAARLREAMAKMEKLETKLSAIEKLNHELMLQEAVYERLIADMADQIAIIRANTIEEAQDAADAVLAAHEAMESLGEQHEFIEATEKAKEVDSLIAKYLEKVDEFGDAKEAYEIVRDLALVAYGQAQEQSSEFEGLEDQMSDLDDLKSAMEDAAEAENYAEAKSKAEELMRGCEALENEHKEMLVHREALLAEARAAISRFDGIDSSNADELAEDEYDEAKEAKSTLEDAMGEDDLEALQDAFNDFRDKLKALEDALKSEEELKAEYEGRRDTLQPQVTAANGSENAVDLEDELEAVNDAFEDMVNTAEDDNDYKRAISKAGDVESALAAFKTAEGVITGQKVRFEERMSGLSGIYGRAIAVTTPDELADRASALESLHEQAMNEAADGNYEDALNTADQVRTEAQAILDEQERLEDEEAAETERQLQEERDRADACEDEEGGDGSEDDDQGIVDEILDEAEDLARDPTGTVSEWLEEKRGPVGEVLENIAQEALEHIPNPPFSEILDEVLDAKDKLDEIVEAVEEDR